MLDNVGENPIFMKRIITGDDRWVYENNVEMSNNLVNGGTKMSRNENKKQN